MPTPAADPTAAIWEAVGLQIDPIRRLVLLDGQPVTLARNEYVLLVLLAREPDRVYTKAKLSRDLWGAKAPTNSRQLDTLAWRLRRALDGRVVSNVWGIGYRLTDPVPPPAQD